MAKQTLQERIIDALETLGCKRVEGKTQRYIVMTKMPSAVLKKEFYFVGKNGALRVGKNVNSSMSMKGIISIDKLFAAAERKRQEQNS